MPTCSKTRTCGGKVGESAKGVFGKGIWFGTKSKEAPLKKWPISWHPRTSRRQPGKGWWGRCSRQRELHVSEIQKEDPVMCLLLQEESAFTGWRHCQSGISCAFAGGRNIKWGWIIRKSSAAKLRQLVYPAWVTCGLLEKHGVLPNWALEVAPRAPSDLLMLCIRGLLCHVLAPWTLAQFFTKAFPILNPGCQACLRRVKLASTCQDLGI